jgi:hypothetical protein
MSVVDIKLSKGSKAFGVPIESHKATWIPRLFVKNYSFRRISLCLEYFNTLSIFITQVDSYGLRIRLYFAVLHGRSTDNEISETEDKLLRIVDRRSLYIGFKRLTTVRRWGPR